MVCGSERLQIYIVHFELYIYIIPTEAVTALFRCYMVTGTTWNCCSLGMHFVCTIKPCIGLHFKATYYLYYIYYYVGCTCIKFSCESVTVLVVPGTCTFGRKWWGLFMCYYGNTGVEWILKYQSAQEADTGELNSPTTPARTWTWGLQITSLALYHTAITAQYESWQK